MSRPTSPNAPNNSIFNHLKETLINEKSLQTLVEQYLFSDLRRIEHYLKEGQHAAELERILQSRFELAATINEINIKAVELIDTYILLNTPKPKAKATKVTDDSSTQKATAEKSEDKSDKAKKEKKKEEKKLTDPDTLRALGRYKTTIEKNIEHYKLNFSSFDDFKAMLQSCITEHASSALPHDADPKKQAINELITLNTLALDQVLLLFKGFTQAALTDLDCFSSLKSVLPTASEQRPANLLLNNMHVFEIAAVNGQYNDSRDIDANERLITSLSLLFLDSASRSAKPHFNAFMNAHLYHDINEALLWVQKIKTARNATKETGGSADSAMSEVRVILIEQLKQYLKDHLPKPPTQLPLSPDRERHLQQFPKTPRAPNPTPRASHADIQPETQSAKAASAAATSASHATSTADRLLAAIRFFAKRGSQGSPRSSSPSFGSKK